LHWHLRRYAHEGKVESVIESSSVRTTCPVLAGPGYQTLYCTRARVGLDKPAESGDALIKTEAIFAAGLSEDRFAGLLN